MNVLVTSVALIVNVEAEAAFDVANIFERVTLAFVAAVLPLPDDAAVHVAAESATIGELAEVPVVQVDKFAGNVEAFAADGEAW